MDFLGSHLFMNAPLSVLTISSHPFLVGLLLHPPKTDDKNGQERTDQRFIWKRNTTYKIHTLEVLVGISLKENQEQTKREN